MDLTSAQAAAAPGVAAVEDVLSLLRRPRWTSTLTVTFAGTDAPFVSLRCVRDDGKVEEYDREISGRVVDGIVSAVAGMARGLTQ